MTTNETNLDQIDVTALELVYNVDGWCAGPQYGQVYRMVSGSYLAGYRSKANEGLGLMGRQTFVTRKAAQNHAVKMSNYS